MENVLRVIIVLHASANHFEELRASVVNIRNYFNNTIIFYNVGLKGNQVYARPFSPLRLPN